MILSERAPGWFVSSGLVVGFGSLAVAILAAGGGHGTYLPAVLLFPFTMLSTAACQAITVQWSWAAIVQFPLYGAVLAVARLLGATRVAALCLGMIHLSAVIACIVWLPGGAFLE